MIASCSLSWLVVDLDTEFVIKNNFSLEFSGLSLMLYHLQCKLLRKLKPFHYCFFGCDLFYSIMILIFPFPSVLKIHNDVNFCESVLISVLGIFGTFQFGSHIFQLWETSLNIFMMMFSSIFSKFIFMELFYLEAGLILCIFFFYIFVGIVNFGKFPNLFSIPTEFSV